MKCLLRIVLLFAFFGSALLAAKAAEVKVLAAASLTDAMQAIATAYESQSSDRILFQFRRFQCIGAPDSPGGACGYLLIRG